MSKEQQTNLLIDLILAQAEWYIDSLTKLSVNNIPINCLKTDNVPRLIPDKAIDRASKSIANIKNQENITGIYWQMEDYMQTLSDKLKVGTNRLKIRKANLNIINVEHSEIKIYSMFKIILIKGLKETHKIVNMQPPKILAEVIKQGKTDANKHPVRQTSL